MNRCPLYDRDSSNHFPIDPQSRQRCPRHLDSSQFPLSLSLYKLYQIYLIRYKSIGRCRASRIQHPTFNLPLFFSRRTKRGNIHRAHDACTSSMKEDGEKRKEKRRRRREEKKEKERGEKKGGEEHAQLYLYRRRNLSHRSRSVGRLGLARWLIISSGNIARYSCSSSDNAISIPRPSGAYGGAAISYKNHDRVCVGISSTTRGQNRCAHTYVSGHVHSKTVLGRTCVRCSRHGRVYASG